MTLPTEVSVRGPRKGKGRGRYLRNTFRTFHDLEDIRVPGLRSGTPTGKTGEGVGDVARTFLNLFHLVNPETDI